MRIALCLSGYFNSLTDQTALGDDGFLYIKKNIFNKVSPESEIDVFFHNWEPDIKENINFTFRTHLIKYIFLYVKKPIIP